MSRSQSAGAIFQGERLTRMLDTMLPQIEQYIDKMSEQPSVFPDIQMDAYLDAQKSPHVVRSIKSLTRNMSWRFVSFRELVEELRDMGRTLFARLLQTPKKCVSFVIDGFNKSSFWVLATLLYVASDLTTELFKKKVVSITSDTSRSTTGMRKAFAQLPANNTVLVLLDDATFSGEQLSYFYHSVLRHWTEAHCRRMSCKPPPVFIGVPFMSQQSIGLFMGATVMCKKVNMFPSLFFRKQIARTLIGDLFLERSNSALFDEYTSFYFDFLGIRGSNTLMLFEHKIADALSIPHQWLMTGQCLTNDYKHAYKVKAEKADELTAAIVKDIRRMRVADTDFVANLYSDTVKRDRISHRDAAKRVVSMMQSPKFRREYMDRVALLPNAVRFVPLMPPEFCGRKYQRYVERRLERAGNNYESTARVPECRKPPYKRDSFKERVTIVTV